MAGPFGRRALRSFVVASATVFVIIASWAAAQGMDPPELVWTASMDAADLPDRSAPGYTIITLDNDSEALTGLSIFRLRDGTTLEHFIEVSGRIDEAMAGPPDPAAIDVLNEGLSLVDVLGGIDAEPSDRRSFGVVLGEGRYALEFTTDGPSQYREVLIEGASGAAAPTADATVHMVDFAFAIPAGLQAGPQTWHVINAGEQLHHMVIVRLNEGATLEQFMESPDDVSTPAGYIGMVSAGQMSYHSVELEPGNHVAVCFLPDHIGDASGMPHFMLGMAQEFAVGQ